MNKTTIGIIMIIFLLISGGIYYAFYMQGLYSRKVNIPKSANFSTVGEMIPALGKVP